METQVITPQPGQSVIVTGEDRHHGRGGHEDHRIDWKILSEQAAGFRDAGAARERFADVVANNHATTVRDIKDARFDLAGEIGRAAAASAAGFAHVGDKLCGAAKDITGAVTHVGEEMCESFDQVSGQIAAARESVVVGFKDQQALAYQVEGRALLEAAKNANSLANQATGNFNLLTVQSERVRTELAAQAQQNTFELRLQAQTNAAAQALALEKCCCELKQQASDIAAKAELTARTLAAEAARQAAECCCELKEKMSTIESNRVRDELNDLKIEAAVARACGRGDRGGGGGGKG